MHSYVLSKTVYSVFSKKKKTHHSKIESYSHLKYLKPPPYIPNFYRLGAEVHSSVDTKPIEVCHSPGKVGQKRMDSIHLFTRTSVEVIQVTSLWNAPLHSAYYCNRAPVKQLNISVLSALCHSSFTAVLASASVLSLLFSATAEVICKLCLCVMQKTHQHFPHK